MYRCAHICVLVTGRVVTMSSDRGMLSCRNSAAYCIAKHGIESFSDVLRLEMADFEVSVSIIQPGHFGAATNIINDKAVSIWMHMGQFFKNSFRYCKNCHPSDLYKLVDNLENKNGS